MTKTLVLYDGWPLAYQPNSPAALHLLALLENLPPSVEAVVALPAQAPAWMPEVIQVQVSATPNRAAARLGWEQRTLPGLANKMRARWLHTTSGAAPLFGPQARLSSPTDFGRYEERPRGLAEHLQQSLGAGGLARARSILWPEGLPAPQAESTVHTVPGVVYSFCETHKGPNPSKSTDDEVKLPETFVLYHGPGSKAALDRLLEAWFWAASSIGKYYPLVLAGLSNRAQWRMRGLLEGTTASEHVRYLPPLSPAGMAGVYRRCSALIHTADEPAWGGPVRHALACRRPVVAEGYPRCEALVGPAAYLTPPGDGRALGAALITVVVEGNVAKQLRAATLERTANWEAKRFGEALEKIYRGETAQA
jgi:glycosyltransferase involved in cell wall biosynthesis